MASFMSGMAGNVTAFNTVWTYDIYQSYIAPDASRRALPVDGPHGHGRSASLRQRRRRPTSATQFNNIMDMLQLVFAFVNAPLFATFLLGHVLEARRPATARSSACCRARSPRRSITG